MPPAGEFSSSLPAFFAAAAVSFGASAIVRRIGIRLGLVVAPRPDRWHRRPTPTYGGLGVFAGLFAGILAGVLSGAPLSIAVAPVIVSGVVLFGVGWYDDWAPLSAIAKMVTSLAVAAFFVITLTGFTGTPIQASFTPIQASLTIVAILAFAGLVNSINLLDNMDGLAAGVASIAAVGLAFTFRTELGPSLVGVLIALAGGLAGFLWWNRPPARLFMGNCGSLAVGGIIAGCAILAVARAGTFHAAAAAVLVLVVPIFDSAFVLLLRRLAGRSTTRGNIDHTSHRLVAAGFTEPMALGSLVALGVAGSVAAVVAHRSPGYAWLLLSLFAVALALLALSLARVPAYGGDDFRALQNAPFAPLLHDLTFRWHAGEVLLDMALITICYYASYRIRFEEPALTAFLASFSRSLPAIVGCQLAALYASGLYTRMWSTFGLHDIATVIRAVTIGMVLSVLAVTYLFKFELFSRSVFIIDAALLVVAIAATRSSFQVFGHLAARKDPRRQRVAIYGAGTRGQLLVREFLANEEWGRLPVAFIDDDRWKHSRRIVGVPVRGGSDNLEAILTNEAVEEVLISAPAIDAAREAHLRAICDRRNVKVRRLFLDLT
jgi:UDP-GlcNAc:undecaprenyl-phosphate GlcNAc-1-phosphate transferase